MVTVGIIEGAPPVTKTEKTWLFDLGGHPLSTTVTKNSYGVGWLIPQIGVQQKVDVTLPAPEASAITPGGFTIPGLRSGPSANKKRLSPLASVAVTLKHSC